MSIIVRRKAKSLSIDKSAWFLCRFLCRNLNEDNFEKIRDHISTCKGVKTRLKLSEIGVEIGYKPSHVRHYHHKIMYEALPLEAAETMIQDVFFINVLLCIFHVENLPDLEFEIIAFKFPDSSTVKRYQDISNILLGPLSQMKTYSAPGHSGNLTLTASKSYHMGSLAPEKWGSAENILTKDSFGYTSEYSYDRSRRNVSGYGTVIPASDVPRRSRHLNVDDDDATLSVVSSGQETFREPIVSATDQRAAPRPAFGTNSNFPNYLRAESSSFDSTQSSGVFRDDDGQIINSNGEPITYTRNIPNNGITMRSVDVKDNSILHDQDQDMTSRRTFKKGSKKNSGEGGDRYFNSSGDNYPKARSFDHLNTGRIMSSSSRSDLYHPSDAISVRSQASYYLVPSFKKVYAPRSGRAFYSALSGNESAYQENRPRI